MRFLLCLAGAVCLSACAVTETPRQETVAETRVNKDGETLICKGEARTGTRIRKDPICKTKEEWDIIADQATEMVDEIRGQTGSVGTLGN